MEACDYVSVQGVPQLSACQALRFLDAVSGNLDSGSEHQFLERKIRDALANVTESVESLEKQISALKSDKKNLEAKVRASPVASPDAGSIGVGY